MLVDLAGVQVHQGPPRSTRPPPPGVPNDVFLYLSGLSGCRGTGRDRQTAPGRRLTRPGNSYAPHAPPTPPQAGGAPDPTEQPRLGVLRRHFERRAVGRGAAVKPPARVRGPKHVVKRGKAPVLITPDAGRW